MKPQQDLFRGTAPGVRVLLVMSVLASIVVSSACQVDSALGDVTCSEDGVRSGDRICQNGYWVSADDVGIDDGETQDTDIDIPDDGQSDDAQDDADSGVQCDAGLERCGSECVDLQTSADHCGRCNNTCRPEGSHSAASCEAGTCDRYCEAGFIDGDDDWAKPTPDADTNGCESTCTPDDDTTELCDGIDNDCDGRVDELLQTYYRDGDGDGYGDDTQTREECGDPPDTYVAEGGDCNDAVRDINPGVDEMAENDGCHTRDDCARCDGVDDDCDGTIDEGCNCTFGDGTGVCAFGIIAENGDCTAPGNYETEESSCDGVDNDCDGATDEGCDCNYQGNNTGVCTNAVRDDSGACQPPANFESNETRCDNRDNNCDGATDEGCDCIYQGKNAGVCTNATRNASGTCTAPAHFQDPEAACDGRDNDCDGQTDEGVKTRYYLDDDSDGHGVTNDSRRLCAPSGKYTALKGGDCNDSAAAVNPDAAEVCSNSIDDNCDGTVNENCQCDYLNTNTGVCRFGTIDPNDGSCTPPTTYQNDERACSDGLDNDCNGIADTDPGCSCIFISQVGVCGFSTYDASGSCQPTQGYESTETTCGDGDDNDCDGQADCQDSDCSGGCIGDACNNDNQCASGYCNPAGECGLTQCGNGVKDSNEVLTDCGAPACLLCASGSCSADEDCKSQSCDTSAGTCN